MLSQIPSGISIESYNILPNFNFCLLLSNFIIEFIELSPTLACIHNIVVSYFLLSSACNSIMMLKNTQAHLNFP
jgi:hypothetical protein